MTNNITIQDAIAWFQNNSIATKTDDELLQAIRLLDAAEAVAKKKDAAYKQIQVAFKAELEARINCTGAIQTQLPGLEITGELKTTKSTVIDDEDALCAELAATITGAQFVSTKHVFDKTAFQKAMKSGLLGQDAIDAWERHHHINEKQSFKMVEKAIEDKEEDNEGGEE